MAVSVLWCVMLVAQVAAGASVGDAQKPVAQQGDKPSPSMGQCGCPSKLVEEVEKNVIETQKNLFKGATQIADPVIKFAVDTAPSMLHLFTLLNGMNGGGGSYSGRASSSAGLTAGGKSTMKITVDSSGSSSSSGAGAGSLPTGSGAQGNAVSGLSAQGMQSLSTTTQQGPSIGLDLTRALGDSAGYVINIGNTAASQGIKIGANLINTLLRSGSSSSLSFGGGGGSLLTGSEARGNANSGLTTQGMQSPGSTMQQGPAIGLDLTRALGDSAGNAMNIGNTAASQGVNIGAKLINTLLRSGSSASSSSGGGGGSLQAGSEAQGNAISGLTAQGMQSLGNSIQQGPAISLDLIRALGLLAGNAMNIGNSAASQGINVDANLINTLLRSRSSSSSSTGGVSGSLQAGAEAQGNAVSGLAAQGMQQGPAIGLDLIRALGNSAGDAMNIGNTAASQGVNIDSNLITTLLSGGSGLMNAAIKDGANTMSNGINAAAGVTGAGLNAAGSMMEQMTRGISLLLVSLGEKLALSISQAEKMAAELLNNANVVDGAVKFNSTSQRDMYNSTDQFVKVLVNIQDWINQFIASTPKPSGQLQVSIKAKACVGTPPAAASPKAKTP